MRKELEAARAAALGAGKILMERYGNVRPERKKDGSIVTAADRESEKYIKSQLSSRFPDYSFLGEEGGLEKRDSEYMWIVDPLDGTTNYSIRNPFFNVSIGLVKSGVPVVGAVYCPVQNEMFTASAGGGAYLNGERIGVSTVRSMDDATIGFCHSRGKKKTIDDMTVIFHYLVPRIRMFRQMGAAALELAYVSCGRLDAFVQIDLKPWDIAAGMLLVREAGGKVTDFSGKDFTMESRNLLACNSSFHGSLMKRIGSALSEGS